RRYVPGPGQPSIPGDTPHQGAPTGPGLAPADGRHHRDGDARTRAIDATLHDPGGTHRTGDPTRPAPREIDVSLGWSRVELRHVSPWRSGVVRETARLP